MQHGRGEKTQLKPDCERLASSSLRNKKASARPTPLTPPLSFPSPPRSSCATRRYVGGWQENRSIKADSFATMRYCGRRWLPSSGCNSLSISLSRSAPSGVATALVLLGGGALLSVRLGVEESSSGQGETIHHLPNDATRRPVLAAEQQQLQLSLDAPLSLTFLGCYHRAPPLGVALVWPVCV